MSDENRRCDECNGSKANWNSVLKLWQCSDCREKWVKHEVNGQR